MPTSDEFLSAGLHESMEDSARVKSYHRTGRILSVAGYLIDLTVLLVLLFSGWSIGLRDAALHVSPRPWLALLIYLILQLGPQYIFSIVLGLKWNLLWVTLVYSASQMARAAALQRSLPEEGAEPYLKMLGVQLSGEATLNLTYFGPFIGEPVKAWLLSKMGLQTVSAVAAVITEYLVYSFTSAILALAGLSYIIWNIQLEGKISAAVWVIVCVMAVFLIVSAIAIVFRIYLIGAVIDAIGKLPMVGKRLPWDRAGVRRMEDLLFVVFRQHPRRFAMIFALDSAAQALLVLELYWIVHSSSIYVEMSQAFLIEAATKFMSLGFFFVPMQVGVAEKTYTIVFEILGLPAVAAVAMSLVRRLRTIILSAVGVTLLARMTGDSDHK